MNVTIKQKEMLVDYLKNHADLVKGRIDRKSESKRKMNDMWNEIAEIINAASIGPVKTGQEWAKTWKDMKCYILKKESKRRSYVSGTGGGSPPKVAFSSLEEEILQLLTPEAAGMENISEGGLNDMEEILQECAGPSNNYMMHEQEMLSYPEVEEENNIENVTPNVNKKKQKNKNTSTKNNETKKEKSVHQLSCSILDTQEIKLKLKKKELKIQKKSLKIQENILAELKEIKCIMQAQSIGEFIV